MAFYQQIPRQSIFWLLIAQTLVVIPHLPRLGIWMTGFWAICIIWRIAMYRGQASYPSQYLKITLIIAGTVGVLISFGNLGGLDLAVALLILAFSLKLVEAKTRRDLNIIFYLAFFVVGTSFLFSQALPLVLFQILSIVVVLTAMIATQRSLSQHSFFQPFKVASKLLLQAIPLMLLLFIVFPRIDPLWAVHDGTTQAGTGFSDEMAPGDVVDLMQSAEVVFQVEFRNNKTIPENRKLYWRGLSLNQFDGRAWRYTPLNDEYLQNLNDGEKNTNSEWVYGEPISYSVIMRPSNQHWLFALPIADISLMQNRKLNKLYSGRDLSWRSSEKINSIIQYNVDSYLNYRVDPYLSHYEKRFFTQLPEGFNPKTLALVEQIKQENDKAQDIIKAVISYFYNNPFTYTLKPEKLGRNTVDDFLFNTQKGYCEHYSNAFVFALRAAGIPSRVVIGYQGGEINPANNILTVRQMDAHAWAEYWIEGKGWQRYDPTTLVAPDRIEYGMNSFALNQSEELSLFSPILIKNVSFIKSISNQFDSINYAWRKWLVGFDGDIQYSVLKALLGEVTSLRIATFMFFVMSGVLSIVAVLLYRRLQRKKLSPELQLYYRFCKKLSEKGFQRRNHEPPQRFYERLSKAVSPKLSEKAEKITHLYQQIVYNEVDKKGNLQQLKQEIKKFQVSKADFIQ